MINMREIKLENYFFDGTNKANDNKKLILVIYDVTENKRRYKLVKFLEKFGKRVQKSAFEMILDDSGYRRLMCSLPRYIEPEDNLRVYRLPLNGEVTAWGSEITEQEEVIII